VLCLDYNKGRHLLTMITLANVSIVLVNPSHPGNIGAAARAIMTMGLTKLVLVKPDNFPSKIATARAAGAESLLEKATVVDSFAEAIAGKSLVVGTSARRRTFTYPHLTPREIAPIIWDEAKLRNVAMCFGREDSGLRNVDLSKCHYHVEIPTDTNYSSLNLAAAVQVLTYELRLVATLKSNLEGKGNRGPNITYYDLGIPGCQHWDEVPAKPEEVDGLMEHFERATRHSGFLKASNPMLGMSRLRRLFNRARIDRVELNILRGILRSIENLKN